MNKTTPRYVALLKRDGWAVLDLQNGEVAVVGSQMQRGLTEPSATATANILNNLCSAGRIPNRPAAAMMRDRPGTGFQTSRSKAL